MKRMLLLYNPTSGKGGGATRLSAMVDAMTKEGWLVTVYPTQEKGDARRMARDFGPQFDRVVCCGGDGTLNETVSGLLELDTPPQLGYIPAGSTNDCATTLHIPGNAAQAARLAASSVPPMPWDIGTLNGRPFVYVAAFGAFTGVAYDTPQDLKNTFGHLAYVVAGIASIPTITPYPLRIEYDGQVLEGEFYYGMVGNTHSVGGMKNIPTDWVRLDDGLFEVILVKKPGGIGEIGAGLQTLVSPSTVESGSAIISFHAASLTVTSPTPLSWTIDGEFGGAHTHAHLQNHQKALSILTGPDLPAF